jgi:hypothetical protein
MAGCRSVQCCAGLICAWYRSAVDESETLLPALHAHTDPYRLKLQCVFLKVNINGNLTPCDRLEAGGPQWRQADRGVLIERNPVVPDMRNSCHNYLRVQTDPC